MTPTQASTCSATDGDTEWVRIGEDHTTNTQYKEYFKAHGNADTVGAGNAELGNLTRLPSLGNGVSFALSAMSQSFGMPTSAEDEKATRLKPPSQQQRLFQQLNLDRTASSMSSFGMYPGMPPRQMSFGHQPSRHHGHDCGGRAPPFLILSPNSFAHSFSSKGIGAVPSVDYGPPLPPHHGTHGEPPHHPYGPPPPPHHHHQQQGEEGRDGVPPGPWPPNHYPGPGYYEGHHYPYPMGPPASSDPSYDSKPWSNAKPVPSKVKSAPNKDLSRWPENSTPLRTGKQCRERVSQPPPEISVPLSTDTS